MKSYTDLLQLLRRGDEEAIRQIFDEFYDRLCHYAAGFTRSFPVAEEIVEDVFIHIWSNSASINITTSLTGYLYKSVYNGCLKYLKSSARLSDIKEITDSNIFLSSDYNDPESDLILQELEKKAEAFMNTLPGQCKEIYFLSRYENLSYSQIAEKLNITVSTVKTQMIRAFQKFKAEFKDWLPSS